MIWGKTYKERTEKFTNDIWFAWYPTHLENRRWCWLERVYRKYWASWGGSGYDYYIPEKSK